jgi:uncharacterized protein (DUF427 family)
VSATWNGTVLADSDHTIVVEGNHYFPPAAIRREHFRASGEHSFCPWKGTASYYDVAVGDEVNAGAAWYYPAPMQEAVAVQFPWSGGWDFRGGRGALRRFGWR